MIYTDALNLLLIIFQWSQIRGAIYEVNWYNESLRTQKTLLNMLTYCTKDKIITAAGIQEFSMKGFSEVI